MKPILSAIKTALPEIVQSTNNNAFRAAGQAIAELGVASCIGTACVKKELLNSTIVQALSKVTFSILLPMFLGTSIVKTVTTNHGNLLNRRTSFALPLVAVLQTYLLFLLSKYLLLPLFGITDDDEDDDARVTMVCCSWGNTSVLPIIFIEALFRHPYEPSSVLAHCYGHISLYLMGWSPFFWSFGRSILIQSDSEINAPVKNSDVDRNLLGGFSRTIILAKIREMKRLIPPPVAGVLVGLIIGLSPLQYLFVNNPSKGYKAPLAVAFNSFQNLGRAASPLALLVLTSSLAIGAGGQQQQQNGAQKDDDGCSNITDKDNNSNKWIQKWACVSVSRFIASPIIMLTCLRFLHKFDMIGNAQEAPILWFVLLLESCMPPAQNAVLMLQVANKGREASELAKFLFCIYVTAMIPVTVIVGISLQRLGLV
uniref:Uncharacterized protein n=1 Tax=Ditylum brightwellii TaxID=49249 RepID=A0A7S1Z3G7_9STRA|mmetsp:Transcript_23275/g.34688  ORF Transcript_23275/g.34688 Transcript_23275/m.34688 type:complete len:426 (+) Transcript_23275:102-1379(+)